MKQQKNVAVLGATGSIGQNTLAVIRHFPELFKVQVLACQNNIQALEPLSHEFNPQHIIVGNERSAKILSQKLKREVAFGQDALVASMQLPQLDFVVSAISGAAGLQSTHAAIKHGKRVALANKESLVMAGKLLQQLAKQTGAKIYPVDSEHSAIFQCLAQQADLSEVSRLILTASGGPFFGRSRREIENVTPEEALRHPTWQMGKKISIDSATLMNKALELIEAHILFAINPDQIDVVIHRQSIVHSMVEFQDGQLLAQMSCPDMKMPIAYALAEGKRLPLVNRKPEAIVARLTLGQKPKSVSQLSFHDVDHETFPAITLARYALHLGAYGPIVLNAANEIAVAAFLAERIAFHEITLIIKRVLESIAPTDVLTMQQVCDIDEISRQKSEQEVDKCAQDEPPKKLAMN